MHFILYIYPMEECGALYREVDTPQFFFQVGCVWALYGICADCGGGECFYPSIFDSVCMCVV